MISSLHYGLDLGVAANKGTESAVLGLFSIQSFNAGPVFRDPIDHVMGAAF